MAPGAKRLVILCGGFAGVHAALHLEKIFAGDSLGTEKHWQQYVN